MAKAESKLKPTVRGYLVWSWFIGLTEEFFEQGLKYTTRSLMNGIRPEDELGDDELVQEFLEVRIDVFKTLTIGPGWVPTVEHQGFSETEFMAELKAFPGFESLLAEAKRERGKIGNLDDEDVEFEDDDED